MPACIVVGVGAPRMRALAWLLLLAVVAAGCASRGVQDAAPSPGEAPVARGCDAARPALAYGAHTDLAPLVPCAFPTNFSSVEPTIGVTRSGAVFFDQAGSLDGGIALARSRDGGVTWDRVTPTQAGQATHATTLDPFLYVDPATGRIFMDDLLTTSCAILSWSDDDGATWAHAATGCTEQDHQSLFAGPPVTSAPSGYPRMLYRCSFNVGFAGDLTTTITCQRSTDGGLTWVQTGAPPYTADAAQSTGKLGLPGHCVMGVGHGATDPKGRILLPAGYCMQPWLAISGDEGATWTRVQVATNGMTQYAGCAAYDDAGVGADANGTLYYGWVAADRLPYLATSRDGGATWSAPRSLAFPGLREAALPQMAVRADGAIAMAFYGSTTSPGQPWPSLTSAQCEELLGAGEGIFEQAGQLPPDPRYRNVTWNAYLVTSPEAGATDPVLFAAQANADGDPMARGECGPLQCGGTGHDFLDVRFAPDGRPWAAFLDLCVQACVRDPAAGNDASMGVAVSLTRWNFER